MRRDNRDKSFVELDGLEAAVRSLLADISSSMYEKALKNLNDRTYSCLTADEIKSVLAEKGDGFIKAMWCGNEECEDKIKELTGAGSRCIPFEQEILSDKCVCCGKPANTMIYWGKAY